MMINAKLPAPNVPVRGKWAPVQDEQQAGTDMPQRIQRKRTKGFRLQEASPDGAPVVYVGRPTRYGNPHDWRDWWEDAVECMPYSDKAAREGWCKDRATQAFEEDLADGALPEVKRNLWRLRGKHLACWCDRYERCHADVLLKLANTSAAARRDKGQAQ